MNNLKEIKTMLEIANGLDAIDQRQFIKDY